MYSDDRYTWLFRRLPVIAALMDAKGRFITVSDAWVERMGYSCEEIRGMTPVDIATPETTTRIRQEHLPQFRRTGRLDNVSVEFIAKNGEPVELLATTIVERDEEGRFRHSLSVFAEPSDRARLERRYRTLYQETPAMLHTIDAAGHITAVTDHWLDKLGYRKDEVIGRSALDFLTEASRREVVGEGFTRIWEFADRKNVPRQMLTKSGDVIDVLMSTRAERDERDGVVRLLIASKDVTERNRSEARLREAYEEIGRLKEELERERDYLREEIDVSMNFGRIVGQSSALTATLARIEAVADTPASVLIIGETGTGKELVAHAIHAKSSRAHGPLVKVNCASIPDDLFESEFFGHVRGAFTGAHRDRIGRFQLADGGTIFLDEVSEIPISLQGKLLRVLQEKEFERVGDDATRSVDVRVIAATNRDLEEAVEAGDFREDLYYRLGVFPVHVPPLRKRGDDVLQLAVHFLEQVCRDFGRPVPALTQTQADALRRYEWPGNIRELKNVVERAVILSGDGPLRLDLSLTHTDPALPPGADAAPAVPAGGGFVTEAEMKMRQRENLLAALEYTHWRISGERGAAKLLGLKPSTLADRIRSWGLRKRA